MRDIAPGCESMRSSASTTANGSLPTSGLSTTGIISFGLALVTGRNRLPKPATGKTAFLSFGIAAPQDLAQLGLIDDRHAEAARFFELGARLGSGHDVVGLL